MDGCCLRLCNSDLDCERPCQNNGPEGEICTEGLCQPGCRERLPTILSLDGNGTENPDGDSATSPHHLMTGLKVFGTDLDGSAVSILGPGLSETVLAVAEGRTRFQMEVCLPPTLTAGAYTLRVVNGAGEACGDFELIQGPQGDPGSYSAGAGITIDNGTISADLDLAGDEILARLNTEATGTLAAGLLPQASIS